MSDIMEDWGISAPQQFQYGLSISNWQFPGYWPHISTKKLNNLNRVHQTNSYTISYIFILQTISYISVFSARILAMLPVVPCMPLIIPVQHGWVEWGAPLVDSDTGRMFVRGEQCFSIIHTHYLVNYDSITQVCPSIESNSCWHTSDVKKSRTTNWNWECYSSVHSPLTNCKKILGSKFVSFFLLKFPSEVKCLYRVASNRYFDNHFILIVIFVSQSHTYLAQGIISCLLKPIW